MIKPILLTPREAARILGVSFPTIKNWIYKGKLRTIKTFGGHHRILEEDVEKHLSTAVASGTGNKWRRGADEISESNQLLGRILRIQIDGFMALVTISVEDHQQLTSIITADAVSELRLKIGDSVVALLKSIQVMILRN